MKLLKFTIISTLVACGGFAPTEGTWNASNFDLSGDACSIAATFGVTASETVLDMTLTATDAGFDIVVGEGDPSACTLDGMDFTCTIAPIVFDFNEGTDTLPAFDAIATFNSALTGSFGDANTATGTTSGDGVCEGEQCDGVIAAVAAQLGTDFEMPCSSSVPFEMTAATE